MTSSNSTANDGQHNGQKADQLTLPDFFVSFCAQKPSLNPYYKQVKDESEAWISKSVMFDAQNFGTSQLTSNGAKESVATQENSGER